MTAAIVALAVELGRMRGEVKYWRDRNIQSEAHISDLAAQLAIARKGKRK